MINSFRKVRQPTRFKFWHMNASGSGEVQIDWMDQEQALDWLHKNAMIITGVHVVGVIGKSELIPIVKELGE